LEEVLKGLRRHFRVQGSPEVTLEANPGTVNLEKLKEYRNLGVNRLSLGIQAFQDVLLQRIGRIHSVRDGLQAFGWGREAGYDNLSIDLMFALPGQTLEEWEESLAGAIEINPEHISLYGLTVERGTPLEKGVASGRIQLPGEEIQARMYEKAWETLGQAGYDHYEISNFAKPEFRSRHNSGYWSGEPYLGLGPSAHSFREPRRWANASQWEDYVAQTEAGGKAVVMEENLGQSQRRLEKIFLGMRRKEGINLREYEQTFGESLEARLKGHLPGLMDRGWVVREGEWLRLSEHGMALADAIFEEIG
jgi:oxygen-independent coproporphyrinogen-3 oxidase